MSLGVGVGVGVGVDDASRSSACSAVNTLEVNRRVANDLGDFPQFSTFV